MKNDKNEIFYLKENMGYMKWLMMKYIFHQNMQC